MTVLQIAPPRLDPARERLEEQILSSLRGQPGFLRFMLMVDRRSGRAIGMSFWETEEALKASVRAAEESRRRAADVAGAVGGAEVQDYEVLIDTAA
jgi:heme-degrading monooxygenase HmoA